MADTPVSAVGDKAKNGARVIASNTVQTNDGTHVALNPDSGRLVLQAPDGYTYTTVASTSVQVGSSTINLLHDTK